MRSSLLASFAAVSLVAILGGLTGWYFYLRTHTQAIRSADTARGFSVGSLPGILGIGGSPGNAGVTPLGSVGGSATTSATTEALDKPIIATPQTPRLWQVTKTPVAGFGFVEGDQGYVMRYAERATGYVFSADPWSGDIERLVNTLRPKTQEAYFSGSSVIMRSFQNGYLDTWSGTVGRSSTSTALVGTSLGGSIKALSLDERSDRMFYLRQTATGLEGLVTLPDGSKPRSVFSSSLTSWKPAAVTGRLVVTQSASDNVPGYSYEIGKGNALTKLAGNISGLMVLPRASSSALIYSSSQGGALSLYARTDFQTSPVRFSLKTIAEKCAWEPDSTKGLFAYCAVPRAFSNPRFLDEWHQGAFFTEDTWWQVDASSGASQALFASEKHPDARNLQVDPSGRFIAFIDGTDSSLWVLRIVQ